mgnify:CR=1 FL=1
MREALPGRVGVADLTELAARLPDGLLQLAPLLASGHIKPVVHAVFAAANAAQAHTTMEASDHVGKIVLDWTTP